jgi:hypothetical protein
VPAGREDWRIDQPEASFWGGGGLGEGGGAWRGRAGQWGGVGRRRAILSIPDRNLVGRGIPIVCELPHIRCQARAPTPLRGGSWLCLKSHQFKGKDHPCDLADTSAGSCIQ